MSIEDFDTTVWLPLAGDGNQLSYRPDVGEGGEWSGMILPREADPTLPQRRRWFIDGDEVPPADITLVETRGHHVTDQFATVAEDPTPHKGDPIVTWVQCRIKHAARPAIQKHLKEKYGPQSPLGRIRAAADVPEDDRLLSLAWQLPHAAGELDAGAARALFRDMTPKHKGLARRMLLLTVHHGLRADHAQAIAQEHQLDAEGGHNKSRTDVSRLRL